MSLSPTSDFVEGSLRVKRFLVENVDAANVVTLASLELFGCVLSQDIVELECHAHPSRIGLALGC